MTHHFTCHLSVWFTFSIVSLPLPSTSHSFNPQHPHLSSPQKCCLDPWEPPSPPSCQLTTVVQIFHITRNKEILLTRDLKERTFWSFQGLNLSSSNPTQKYHLSSLSQEGIPHLEEWT